MKTNKQEYLKTKIGWLNEGVTCKRLGPDVYVGGQYWTPVEWDEERLEDPGWAKSVSLQPHEKELMPETVPICNDCSELNGTCGYKLNSTECMAYRNGLQTGTQRSKNLK